MQLLKERNELKGQFGQATLGILLAQDMATVPFLVLLPLIEGGGPASAAGGALAAGAAGAAQGGAAASVLTQLGPIAAKTLGGLAGLLVGGRLFLRRCGRAEGQGRVAALVLPCGSGYRCLGAFCVACVGACIPSPPPSPLFYTHCTSPRMSTGPPMQNL